MIVEAPKEGARSLAAPISVPRLAAPTANASTRTYATRGRSGGDGAGADRRAEAVAASVKPDERLGLAVGPGAGARQRNPGELPDRRGGELARLGLLHQAGQLPPLALGQPVAAAPAATHQLDDPPPLGRIELGDVLAGQQQHLGDREQARRGNAP